MKERPPEGASVIRRPSHRRTGSVAPPGHQQAGSAHDTKTSYVVHPLSAVPSVAVGRESAQSTLSGHRHGNSHSYVDTSRLPSSDTLRPSTTSKNVSTQQTSTASQKNHSIKPGVKIQYPLPLQVYYEERRKAAGKKPKLPYIPLVLERLPGERTQMIEMGSPPLPPSPSAFPTIMALLQTPSEASFKTIAKPESPPPPVPPVPAPSRTTRQPLCVNKTITKDARPKPKEPAHLLAPPFPKPAPHEVKESDLQRPVLPPLPQRVATGCEFEDIQHEARYYLHGLFDYGTFLESSEKAFREKDVDSARNAGEKLVFASKKSREDLMTECAKELRKSVHVRRAVQEVETWELLFESHYTRARPGAAPEDLDLFFRMGLYLVGQLSSANFELARLMDSEFSAQLRRPADFADASLPPEYDRALKSLHERVKKGKKQGLLSRLVDQAMAQVHQRTKNLQEEHAAKPKRKIPDVTAYPPAPPPSNVEPVPKCRATPEYFDENCEGSLTEITLDLRASVVAFHLVARHYRLTGQMAPIPQNGNFVAYDKRVNEATLPELVRYLTDHFEDVRRENKNLMDAFWQFFRYLISPLRLLHMFLDRYKEKPPANVSREAHLEWRARHVFTKLFIVRMIAMWLDRYYLALEDKVILDELREFTFKYVVEDTDLPPKASWIIAIQLCECYAGRRGVTYTPIVEQAIRLGQDAVKTYPPTAFQKHVPVLDQLYRDGRIGGADFLFFHQEGGAEEIARAFTRLEAMRFQKNQPVDMINWTRDKEPEWMMEAEKFARAVSLWTGLSVIDHEYPEERAKAVEIWIEVAWICFKMRNFSSSSAIVVALRAVRVRRLTETMKLVSKNHHYKLQDMRDFFESEDDSPYHREMERIIGPAVPSQVLVRLQMTKMTEYGPGLYASILQGKDYRHPIDFKTLREVGKVVRELECCYTPYRVPVLAVVWEYLKSQIEPLQDYNASELAEGLDKLSRIREPSVPQPTGSTNPK